eukprot:6256919-Amphidinium_carterae.1
MIDTSGSLIKGLRNNRSADCASHGTLRIQIIAHVRGVSLDLAGVPQRTQLACFASFEPPCFTGVLGTNKCRSCQSMIEFFPACMEVLPRPDRLPAAPLDFRDRVLLDFPKMEQT